MYDDMEIVSTSFGGDGDCDYMIDELTYWAYEELLSGNRSKASRIYKVIDRMKINNKKRRNDK